jgi:DNA-binding transcriptional LysR family regulator
MRTLKSPSPASDPDWDDLKVLLALSRGASVAAAARAMGVDQSTVSRRLAALEEAVGCPLLVRGGREFSWTAEGRTMVGAAEAAEAALQAATRHLRTSRLDAAGVVRVSTTPGIAAFLLRVLPDFQRKHRGLELDLSGSMEHMDLAKGEADIALRGGEPTEPDMVARRLIRGAWFLYASEACLREAGRPQSLDDLRHHRLVLLTPALQTSRWGCAGWKAIAAKAPPSSASITSRLPRRLRRWAAASSYCRSSWRWRSRHWCARGPMAAHAPVLSGQASNARCASSKCCAGMRQCSAPRSCPRVRLWPSSPSMASTTASGCSTSRRYSAEGAAPPPAQPRGLVGVET